jgi:hypothetical protein
MCRVDAIDRFRKPLVEDVSVTRTRETGTLAKFDNPEATKL